MKILLVAMLAVNAWGMKRDTHETADQLIAAFRTATDNLKNFLERKDNALVEKYDPKNTSKNLSPIKERSCEESSASSQKTIIDALNEFETTIQDMKNIKPNRKAYLNQKSPEKESSKKEGENVSLVEGHEVKKGELLECKEFDKELTEDQKKKHQIMLEKYQKKPLKKSEIGIADSLDEMNKKDKKNTSSDNTQNAEKLIVKKKLSPEENKKPLDVLKNKTGVNPNGALMTVARIKEEEKKRKAAIKAEAEKKEKAKEKLKAFNKKITEEMKKKREELKRRNEVNKK